MSAKGRPGRFRSAWLGIAALCGALLAFAAPAQAEQPIGTVIGVPMWELEGFVRANTAPGLNNFHQVLPANNVRVLHVAPEFNSAIVTVAVTQSGTGRAATSVYFPTFGNGTMARIYRQINADDDWSFPQIFGAGYAAVMKVNVGQSYSGTFVPGRTRFMLVPWDAVSVIVAANPPGRIRGVHRQRARIGAGNLSVALIAIDPFGQLASNAVTVRVPGQVYPVDIARAIRSLNANVSLGGRDPSNATMALLVVR